MKKKSLIIPFLLLTSLVSCNSSNDDGGNESPTPTDELIFKKLNEAKELSNYTIHIEDYGGDFDVRYTKNTYLYQFNDEQTINGYIEDETGIYAIKYNVFGEIENDYYIFDMNSETYLKNLYDNMLSLKDLSLDENIYTLTDDKLYLTDIGNEESQILFELSGYDSTSTIEGMRLSDITTMYFDLDESQNVRFNMEFNKELDGSRGKTTFSVLNVGSTEIDAPIKEFLDKGGKGKIKLLEDDPLFNDLAALKNMRNFTLKVRSDYKKTENNYEVTSLYTSKAYYSKSSREGENDLGFVETTDGLKELIFDSTIGEGVYLEGELIKNSSGSIIKDLYSYVYSFSSTSWNPINFEATKTGDTYTIDDDNYLYEVFLMADEVAMKYQLVNLTYSKENEGYHFVINMIEGDKIYLDVTNVGSTVIGDYKD